MKKTFMLLLMVMFAFGMNAQYIYNDFDANQNVPFVGGDPDPTTIANPHSGGINTSPNVAEWVRSGGAWSHAKATVEGFIDFTTGTTFTLKAYSPINTTVKFKLEGIIGPVEVDQTITAGSWQELSFDFPGAPNDSYNAIVIFFDPGNSTTDTYYFDDVEGPAVSNDPPPVGTLTLPVTFDDPDAAYDLIDFGGTVSQIIVDPDDAANNIVETIKTETAEFWAGTTVGGTVGFAEPVPFTVDSTLMGVMVWSPEEGIPVRLKVEDANNGGIFVETETVTTVAAAWDTLVFNFANPAPNTPPLNLANNYNKASIFFNFGTTGAVAGEQTYYWDYMYFKGAPEPKPLLELDVQDNFEDDGWGTIDEWFFQDPDMNALLTTADPEDGSNTVADYYRSGGFQWTNAQFVLEHRLDLTERNKFELDVYFPSSNDYTDLTTTAAIKLQNSKLGGNAWTTQTEIVLTVENLDQWETLLFDFSAIADSVNYDQVVIQLGGEGHWATGQLYFDNLYLKHVPYVTVLTPNGGEDIEQGEEFEITWEYGYWNGPIKIDLLKGGTNPVTIAFNIPVSDGSFLWNVFSNLALGDDYSIRISGINAGDPSDESDGYFTVIEPMILPQIVFSEIMYNPPESGNDSLEFLEFFNKGDEAVNMEGFYMSMGVEHTFPAIVIEPDTFFLLAKDSLAMFAAFGVESYQWTNGVLDDSGDTIELSDQFGNVINTVAYSDTLPWDTLADGHGPSLELLNPDLDNSMAESWMASVNFMAVNADGDSIWASPGFGFAELAAAFEADSTLILVGDSVMFTDLSTGSPTSWMWTFEGGTPETYEGEMPPYIAYNQAGKWDVTLVVSDGDESDTLTYEEYIWSGMMPVAGFEASDTQILAGQTVDFVNLSEGDDNVYSWMFEGGEPATSIDENPTGILYNEVGAFSVTLIASNSFGADTLEMESYIMVTPVGIASYENDAIQIYPNPATSQLNISLPDAVPFDLYLLNLSGQKIDSQEKQLGLIHLNTSELQAGIYVLMMRNTENGETVSKKIIIN